MKKFLLGLSTLGAAAIPLVTVVACGSSSKPKNMDITTEKQWDDYLDASGFDAAFIAKAKKAIDWSSGIILKDDGFKDTTIPTGIRLPLITSIGVNAFNTAHIPFIFIIPSSVIEIKANAFTGTDIPPGFTIPLTVKTLSPLAFFGSDVPQGFKWSKLDANNHPLPGASVIAV